MVLGLGSNVISIIVKMEDKFSGPFDKIEASMGKINKTMLATGTAMTAAGVGGVVAIQSISEEAGKGVAIGNAFSKMFGDKAPDALETLRTATKGTVSDIDIMTQANQALLLGIDPEALPKMFEGAFAAAQATGRPVSDAISDITTGIGRQSKLILDNLGIMVNAESANLNYALSLGKTVSELSDEEKKIAFTNAVMEALVVNTERIGEVTDNAALATQRANANWDNAKQKLGEALAPVVIALTDKISILVGWFSALDSTTVKIFAGIALIATGFLLIAGPILTLIALIPLFVTGIELLTIAFTALNIPLLPFTAAIFAAIASIALLIVLWQKWNELSTITKVILMIFLGPLVSIIAAIKAIQANMPLLIEWWDKFKNAITGVKAVIVDVLGFLSQMVSHVTEFGRAVASLFSKASAATGGGKKGKKKQFGGLITSPTLALVGEAGPERITPLGRPHARGAAEGGMNGGINITIEHMTGVGLTIEELADAFEQRLRRMIMA